MTKKKPLFTGSDWDEALVYKMWKAADAIGQKYKLDYYRPQIEIISSEQMIDNISKHGLAPTYYHWSFGKTAAKQYEKYQKGRAGLAFEIVINSEPSLCYIMNNNTALMQQLVIAHAAVGHSSFFKMNYLFKEKTDAPYIMDFLRESRKFILDCEQLYGVQKVETLLDAAHTIAFNSIQFSYNIDKTQSQREQQLRDRLTAEEENQHPIFDKLIKKPLLSRKEDKSDLVTSNLLLLFEQHSTHLKPWEKKILSIVRYLAEYFYPQMLTKVSNEGWASFWHYTILNEMFDNGQLTDGHMLEFISSHSGVLYQPDTFLRVDETRHGKQVTEHPHWSDFNPYTLGFMIYQDIKRLSMNPTAEDYIYNPDMAGGDWVENITFAMQNYRDDTFIQQFLTPAVIRKLKLFAFRQKDVPHNPSFLEIYDVLATSGGSHEEFLFIKNQLSKQHNYSEMIPEVVATLTDTGKLSFTFPAKDDKVVHQASAEVVIKMIQNRLWGPDREIIINHD